MLILITFFVFFIAMIGLIIGWISPSVAIPFGKGEAYGRAKVTLIYGIIAVVFMLLLNDLLVATEKRVMNSTTGFLKQEQVSITSTNSSLSENIQSENVVVDSEEDTESKDEVVDSKIDEQSDVDSTLTNLNNSVFETDKISVEVKEESSENSELETEQLSEAEKQMQLVAAKKLASDYLLTIAFSKVGLVEFLMHEGYSESVATEAVEALHVNWNKQAVLIATDYIEDKEYTRRGLIEQLVFEGFSEAEATYAANEIGL